MVVDWGDCRGRRVSSTGNHLGPVLCLSVVVVVRRASIIVSARAVAIVAAAAVAVAVAIAVLRFFVAILASSSTAAVSSASTVNLFWSMLLDDSVTHPATSGAPLKKCVNW